MSSDFAFRVNYYQRSKVIMNKNLKTYIMLWSTQSISALGSGMTSYALVLWLYISSGSALKAALLSVCSYAPYVAINGIKRKLC